MLLRFSTEALLSRYAFKFELISNLKLFLRELDNGVLHRASPKDFLTNKNVGSFTETSLNKVLIEDS